MSSLMVVAALVAAAVLVLPLRRPGAAGRRLLTRVRADSGAAPAQGDPVEASGTAPARDDPVAARRADRRFRLLLAAGAGLGTAGFIGTWWGLGAGVLVGAGTERFLRTREPAAARRDRSAALDALPLAADLLAAALRAGAPVDRAAAAVADALGGPLGDRLRRTARSLRLGAEPGEAWTHLADVPGAERLTAAAVRSSASGGALAGALERLAVDLRADRSAAAEAAAQRAGVLIVLPLGLCFLPAFVLAGLVPVLVAVLGDVI